jgi:ribosomal protein S18 acetylase RimI-like enzyme
MSDWSTRELVDTDRSWLCAQFRSWGDEFIVTRGRKAYPEQVSGFIAERPDGEKVGLVTYEVIDGACEIVTLNAFDRYQGIGTALVECVCDVASSRGVGRVWLITTNDNVDALRFYQRSEFSLVAVHVNAIDEWRRLKPTIRRIGLHGIPLRDELELERRL